MILAPIAYPWHRPPDTPVPGYASDSRCNVPQVRRNGCFATPGPGRLATRLGATPLVPILNRSASLSTPAPLPDLRIGYPGVQRVTADASVISSTATGSPYLEPEIRSRLACLAVFMRVIHDQRAAVVMWTQAIRSPSASLPATAITRASTARSGYELPKPEVLHSLDEAKAWIEQWRRH